MYRFCFSSLFLGLFFSTVAQEQPTIKLIFVGDIMGHMPQIESAKTTPNTYDYRACFEYVAPILKGADVAIGNLELTLPGKGPYSGYPMFRSPDALATALRDAGFDLLVTSNNHSCDGGLLGVTHTLDVLDSLGIQHTGTFRNTAERSALYPLIVHHGAFRIAILNATYGTNGVPIPAPSVVNLIDTAQMRLDILEARAQKPDFIISVMHWGLEYQLNENEVQSTLAKWMLSQGVDVVIGGHPHVVQPVKEELYLPLGGTTERKGLVVYSLGNFISNQRQANTDGGLMFELTLQKQSGARAKIISHHYLPIWRWMRLSGGKTTYHVVPIALYENRTNDLAGMTAAQVTAMKAFAANTRARLGKYQSTERK